MTIYFHSQKTMNQELYFSIMTDTPHLISAAIQERYGKPLSVFADEFLFKPLGITEWKWEAANDGITFGAVSIFMKPRDVAKFGQMLLQNGKWGDQQIVDSSWIAEATIPHCNNAQSRLLLWILFLGLSGLWRLCSCRTWRAVYFRGPFKKSGCHLHSLALYQWGYV